MDMSGSIPFVNYRHYKYSQTEGGPPTFRPALIARSPFPSSGDEERDMNRGNQKRVPPTQPKELGQQTKTMVNPRGPHYSGPHGQRSSTTSSHSSLSESSSGESRLTRHSGTVSPPRTQEHPHYSSTHQGQYSYQYRNQLDPYDTNVYQYSDGRYVGPTMSTRPQQQQATQYQGRRYQESYLTPNYYVPHIGGEYGTTVHQAPSTLYHPQATQYRQLSHSQLIKSHSEERFRDSHHTESQRGFSSLGELPDPCDEQQLTMRPVPTQYRYDTPLSQYGEPTRSPSPPQYPSQPPSYHDLGTTAGGMEGELSRLSEHVEAMRIQGNVDDDIEIVEQPMDQTVDLSERVVFTCKARVAHCEEEPNLLWFKNLEPLIGEIDTMYVIEETTEKDAGTYHCLVTHPLDEAKHKESYTARLTVRTKGAEAPPEPPLAKLPKIVSQPTGRLSAVVGEPLEVSIQACGDEPLTYKWYRNSIPLQFAQSAELYFPTASITDSGDYCCQVANAHGSILSKVFTLEVTRARVAATDLSDAYLLRTSLAIARQVRSAHELAHLLRVKMSFYGNLEDQILHLLKVWRDSRRGTRQHLLSVLKQLRITLGDVERSQVFGQPNTGKLVIIQHPQSAKVIYGQPFTLQVAVSCKTSSTTFQWFLNGKPLIGQSSPYLSISSVVESDVGEYVCVVKDRDIKIKSEPAVVEVTDAQTYHSRAANPVPQTKVYKPPNPQVKGRGPSSPQKHHSSVPFQHKEQQATIKDVPHGISISEHPTSVEIEPGDPMTLQCKASCPEGELSYSWYFNGLLIKDEEQSEYVLNFFTDEDEGFYTCKVSNQYGSVLSNVAEVKVKQDSD